MLAAVRAGTRFLADVDHFYLSSMAHSDTRKREFINGNEPLPTADDARGSRGVRVQRAGARARARYCTAKKGPRDDVNQALRLNIGETAREFPEFQFRRLARGTRATRERV